MTSTGAVHILHVRPDPDDPEDRVYSVTCPHDADDLRRPCVLWWECMNHPDGTRDELEGGDGEGPCDEAPSDIGYHALVAGMVASPSRQCIVAHHDRLTDSAHDLGLPVGDHPVDWDGGDFDEFYLLTIETSGSTS